MSRRLADDGSLDGDLVLRLLEAVETEDRLTQRSLADSLGIALGLTNAYVKRCVRKGWVRIRRVKPNRYRYFLTPKGFSEKARLTARYLASSLKYVATIRRQLDAVYARCEILGRTRIVIVGEGELAELAMLCAGSRGVDVMDVIDPAVILDDDEHATRPHVAAKMAAADAVVVVDLAASPALLTRLGTWFTANDVHRPALLSGDSGSKSNS